MSEDSNGEQAGGWLSSMPGVAARMAFEQAAARIIQLDTVTAQRLQALDDRVLQVSSTTPVLDIYVRMGEKPTILAVWEHEVDCRLEGSAVELMRLALSDEPLVFLQQSGITLTGNSDLLNTAAAIAREADFDWEGQLAKYTGGIFAHMLGSVVRSGHRSARKTADIMLTNLPEFIQEELRVLPPVGEVDAFREDLDELRLAADRLQARVARLDKDLMERQDQSASDRE
ncbi:ubiquinone biosynthesis accessory factor UbiJ [Parendozoicomonas haliclonae]|uniref:Ubiquinone biosynthesis accessory factor UbiJ n=1 Tax=Parendozoicomonas haliclonae TaxID=1960125 RepID=A0A1X7AFF4_9GAMM|nr:SCP2 sterol-binding domain-containing protein [Parendozoicomonas haliclonae]SMA35814.1 hypothetical protein EHSB41UT_00562 [Parendozoicomonas haliclonae]